MATDNYLNIDYKISGRLSLEEPSDALSWRSQCLEWNQNAFYLAWFLILGRTRIHMVLTLSVWWIWMCRNLFFFSKKKTCRLVILCGVHWPIFLIPFSIHCFTNIAVCLEQSIACLKKPYLSLLAHFFLFLRLKDVPTIANLLISAFKSLMLLVLI